MTGKKKNIILSAVMADRKFSLLQGFFEMPALLVLDFCLPKCFFQLWWKFTVKEKVKQKCLDTTNKADNF